MKKKSSTQKRVKRAPKEDFFFDDCAICQGMKKAQESGKTLNLDELQTLFKKQNTQN